MIGGCLSSGKYNMTATVYRKESARNENTGQVKAVYANPESFSLIARGLSNLRGKDSGTLSDWGNKLNEFHYLRIKTMTRLEESDLVTQIVDAGGSFYLDEKIQFIVLGVTPTFDPFGNFIEYDILCNKSTVQVKLPAPISQPVEDRNFLGSTEESSLVIS